MQYDAQLIANDGVELLTWPQAPACSPPIGCSRDTQTPPARRIQLWSGHRVSSQLLQSLTLSTFV
jgi:hypothetical protein